MKIDMHKKKQQFRICVVTTTRADYGILHPLLVTLFHDATFDLRIAVSGTHLSEAFGLTIREIEADNFPIDVTVPILKEENNSPKAMSHIMARAIEGFSVYFQASHPDLLVVLGDRFEVFAICAAAVNACIPIAHLYGGETTEGLMDECFRHSITKMSYLHFTATEAYRKRVIQLGEQPGRVFHVGALGVENALHTAYLTPAQLESDLGFPLFQKPYAVVTFHPVTLEAGSANTQTSELLSAIAQRNDLNFLITKSNADMGGEQINELIDAFSKSHSHCSVVSSLGMRRYMSALKYAACVVGNSSSGIVEVPSFGIPTINIGNRQQGRIQAESVINCKPVKESILHALELACSDSFLTKAASVVNPYGDGNSSERIAKIIKDILLAGSINLEKKFYDIPFEVQP